MSSIILLSDLEAIGNDFRLNRYYSEGRTARKLPKVEGRTYQLVSTHQDMGVVNGRQDGFLEFFAAAYNNHLKVAIAPQDIWFMLMTQVSACVNANPEQYRAVFTTAEGKTDIMIPTGDITYLPLDILMRSLEQLVPNGNAHWFTPEFSTDTDMSRRAIQGVFAEAVQHYYNYMTYCCGIPAVKVVGTVNDWTKLVSCLRNIGDLLGGKLQEWLLSLEPRFTLFIDTLKGAGDPEEWKNIYTQRNIGSGGELIISGWITEFYMTKPDLPKLENFRATLAVVPYTNLETHREFRAVFAPSVRLEDTEGFMRLGYVEEVFELMPAEVK